MGHLIIWRQNLTTYLKSVAIQTTYYAGHAGQAVRVSPDRRIAYALPGLSGNGETAFRGYEAGAVAPGLHDGLYLRCAGYTKADVSEELSRHALAPSSQREKNIRVFYEHRIVGQAFGVAGNIDIASFQPTLEQIQKFNQEAEEMERDV